MRITLIGAGCGTADTLTERAKNALRKADVAIGSPRLLETLPEKMLKAGCRKVSCVTAGEIASQIESEQEGDISVLFSGDTGFYSGARSLLPLIQHHEVTVLPGISSVQALSARLGRPWQDWRLFSAHGASCDVVSAVCCGRPSFFLTGGKTGPAEICRELADAGLGKIEITVGESLFLPEEKVTHGKAEELQDAVFAPLSVVLAEPAPRIPKRVPGLEDGLFERVPEIPMTKRLVRAAVLSELEIGPEDVCWDIGAGTGSVGIEMALQAREVWGVEHHEEALRLACENRRKFGAWNLHLIQGSAPEALEKLPEPNAVFIGGSGGKLGEIISTVRKANPSARICVAAVTLETLERAREAFSSAGEDAEITQLSVSQSRNVGKLHLMEANNPIFLITGRKQ